MPIFCALVSIIVLFLSALLHPTQARGPNGWYVNGVSPDGAYELRRAPVAEQPPCKETKLSCVADEPDVWIRGRIYCTGGSRAIVVDERTVGCTR